MKTIKSTNHVGDTFKKLFAVVTTGAVAAVPFFGTATPAVADPPRHAPAHGYRDRDNDRDRRDGRDRWDGRRDGHRDGRYDGRRDDRRDRWDDHRDGRWDDRRDGRWDDRRDNDYRSITGTVTRVRGSREFDVRADGRTYNVTSSYGLPRGFDRGDIVRVYGVRRGDNNNLYNARVSIIRNR